ncbi:unnamed protein product, partial [marine sediment metagenome]
MTSPNFGKKDINKEINRITVEAKDTPLLLTGVPALDKSGGTEVPFEVLTKILTTVIKKSLNTTIFLIVAGKTKCQAIVYIPESVKQQLSASEWVTSCIMTEVGGDKTKVKFKPSKEAEVEEHELSFLFAELECEYPLKKKD